MSEAPPQATAERVVPLRRNRDFLLLWSGAGLSTLGHRLVLVAYPLLIMWETGSASAVGILTAAAVLPQLIVQLPAGVVVDRVDRRRLMILCNAGCAAIASVVLAAFFLGHVLLPLLMVAAFVHGSLIIFSELADRAAVRHVVHESQVPLALSQNEARSRAVGMLGDPAGSLLFGLLKWTPILAVVLVHVISVIELLFIRKNFQAERTEGSGVPFHHEVAEGISWLWRQDFLRVAVLLISGTNFVFTGIALTPVVIIYEAGSDPSLVGIVLAIGGLGGVLGAMTASWWRRRMSLSTLFPVGITVWTLSILPLALASGPLELGVIFAVICYIGGVFNVAGYVYAVQSTPDKLLGRVMSVVMLLGSGANFVGALLIGFLLEGAGMTATVLGMAAVMAVLAVVAYVHPAVRGVAATPFGGRTDPSE